MVGVEAYVPDTSPSTLTSSPHCKPLLHIPDTLTLPSNSPNPNPNPEPEPNPNPGPKPEPEP